MEKTSVLLIIAVLFFISESGSSGQERLEKKREIASKAKQIEEYQKILIRLNEIKEDKIKIENLFKSKSFEIVDIEPSYQEPFIPEDAFEIIE